MKISGIIITNNINGHWKNCECAAHFLKLPSAGSVPSDKEGGDLTAVFTKKTVVLTAKWVTMACGERLIDFEHSVQL